MESREDTRGKGKKKTTSGIVETRGTSLDLRNEMREDDALTLLRQVSTIYQQQE
jgi:hypothetical protein